MTHSTATDTQFSMPLTLKFHHQANQFRQHHANPEKAKQVYLNTLAVQTVHTYLHWLGVPTNLEASDSWNPALQSLMDTADLQLTDKGSIQCCAIVPGGALRIPDDVPEDCLGYMAVQLDAALTEGTIAGFLPASSAIPAGTIVPLAALRSVETLLDQLADVPAPVPVQLGAWLQGVVEASWQTVEELFRQPQPVLSFRGAGFTHAVVDEPTVQTRGKHLSLGPENHAVPVILLVGIQPIDPTNLDIWVKLCPANEQTHLPPELELSVLDEAGSAVMQAQSRGTEMIQLQFGSVPGEQFSLQIKFDTMTVTEEFVI